MTTNADPRDLARQLVARSTAVVALAGIALIHLLDITSKFAETPYMGWMYLGLMATALGLAAALVHGNHYLAWVGAAVLPASAAIGFILTRTTGLPQAHGDIGNWSEPLGMASLFVEGALVVLSGWAAMTLVPAHERRVAGTMLGRAKPLEAR